MSLGRPWNVFSENHHRCRVDEPADKRPIRGDLVEFLRPVIGVCRIRPVDYARLQRTIELVVGERRRVRAKGLESLNVDRISNGAYLLASSNADTVHRRLGHDVASAGVEMPQSRKPRTRRSRP